MPINTHQTVIVALSGGVDSAVAAALLVEQGWHVIGVTLNLWQDPGKTGDASNAASEGQTEARRIADMLGIPFHVVDAADIFRSTIIQYFLDDHAAGKTPNPCVRCNKHIKFGYLYETMQALGGDFLATGHYIRQAVDENGHKILKRAADPQKDQSYVMCLLNQEKVDHALFPLGELSKPEVRRIAQSMNLPIAQKKDSQDLCFIENETYKDFLMRHAPHAAKPGLIVTVEGQAIGEHQGLAFYTIGQRKGIGIASSEGYYVIGKDAGRNVLTVGRLHQLGRTEIFVKQPNWINGMAPQTGSVLDVKIRYKATLQPAELIQVSASLVKIRFETPVRDATPGQFAVFYRDDTLLGGGEIDL